MEGSFKFACLLEAEIKFFGGIYSGREEGLGKAIGLGECQYRGVENVKKP
jgi:hypothetical protein